MYQFRIIKQMDGGFKFELGEIKMFIEGYSIANNKHILTNPAKAIAYFNIKDNIYGVSNEPLNLDTAEAFFDVITSQYEIVSGNDNKQELHKPRLSHQA